MWSTCHRSSRASATLIAAVLGLALVALAGSAVRAQVSRDGPTATYTVIVNECLAPGCTELASAIAPVGGVAVTVSNAEDGEVFGSCVTGAEGRCTVDIRLVETLAFTFDESTLPAGHRLDANPQIVPNQATAPGAHAELPVLLFPVDGFPPDAPAPTSAPPVETPAAPPPDIQPGGMPTGIYAGTCAEGELGELVAPLNGPALPEGAQQGATDAIPVPASFTVIDVPFRDMLNGGIVLAVFDEASPETMVACGPVGGILDVNGALTMGLAPVGGSGTVGVAYLSAQQDATATGISLFLVPPPGTEPAVPGA